MRLDNPNHIDIGLLSSERPDRGLTIQFSDPSVYGPGILKEVDRACEFFGSRLDVRFYGHFDCGFDCRMLRLLPNARSLSLDCLDTIENLDHIRDLGNLESFGFGVFESASPGFLQFANIRRLRRLVLGDNRRNDMDLDDLAYFEHLKDLTIVGHHKNIAVLKAKNCIESLALRSMPKKVGLSFVSTMGKLVRLSISLGGRPTIEEIAHGTLESLELLRIRGLAKVLASAFRSLTNLEIEDQVRITELDVGGAPGLRRLRVINCPRLTRIERLEGLVGLDELRLSRTGLDPDALFSRRLPTKIASLHIGGYGAKRDRQIVTRLKSMGHQPA